MEEQIATLRIAIGGKFAQFERGERVKVHSNHGSTCTIERVEWRGSTVPLTNICAGIPVSVLKFEQPKEVQP